VVGLLMSQIILSLVLALAFLIRPGVTANVGWKIVAFIGLCILPAMCIVGGMNTHIVRSEQRRFCISCHAMEPYGRSLYLDDSKFLPAQHFQNHRVPPDTACEACHADYSIYGPLKDKARGLTRIFVQYVSTPPEPASIRIEGGFKNGQCLHCHEGARDFMENPVHSSLMASLMSNQMSCLTSGCHDAAHDVDNLKNEKFWSPGQ